MDFMYKYWVVMIVMIFIAYLIRIRFSDRSLILSSKLKIRFSLIALITCCIPIWIFGYLRSEYVDLVQQIMTLVLVMAIFFIWLILDFFFERSQRKNQSL